MQPPPLCAPAANALVALPEGTLNEEGCPFLSLFKTKSYLFKERPGPFWRRSLAIAFRPDRDPSSAGARRGGSVAKWRGNAGRPKEPPSPFRTRTGLYFSTMTVCLDGRMRSPDRRTMPLRAKLIGGTRAVSAHQPPIIGVTRAVFGAGPDQQPRGRGLNARGEHCDASRRSPIAASVGRLPCRRIQNAMLMQPPSSARYASQRARDAGFCEVQLCPRGRRSRMRHAEPRAPLMPWPERYPAMHSGTPRRNPSLQGRGGGKGSGGKTAMRRARAGHQGLHGATALQAIASEWDLVLANNNPAWPRSP